MCVCMCVYRKSSAHPTCTKHFPGTSSPEPHTLGKAGSTVTCSVQVKRSGRRRVCKRPSVHREEGGALGVTPRPQLQMPGQISQGCCPCVRLGRALWGRSPVLGGSLREHIPRAQQAHCSQALLSTGLASQSPGQNKHRPFRKHPVYPQPARTHSLRVMRSSHTLECQ